MHNKLRNIFIYFLGAIIFKIAWKNLLLPEHSDRTLEQLRMQWAKTNWVRAKQNNTLKMTWWEAGIGECMKSQVFNAKNISNHVLCLANVSSLNLLAYCITSGDATKLTKRERTIKIAANNFLNPFSSLPWTFIATASLNSDKICLTNP